MEKIIRNNRAIFSEGKDKLPFLPNKYFQKFQDRNMTNYDHPMIYRDREYDYFIVSLYPGTRNKEILEEGFCEIDQMYSTSCQSYMKIFKNTRSSRVEELTDGD